MRGVLPLTRFACALACALPVRASAQSFESTRAPAPRPVEIGAGVQGLITLGSSCRPSGDLVACEAGESLVGLEAGPRWRVWRALAFGVQGGVLWDQSTEDSRTLWSAAAELRVYPWSSSDLELFFAVDGGVVATVDRFGLGTGSGTDTEQAPLVAAAVGADWQVNSLLALGPALRGLVFFFPESRRLNLDRPSHGTEPAIAVSLAATFRLGASPP